MGCLFAAGLVSAGCEVSLVLRQAPDRRSDNVTVESAAGSKRYPVHLEDNASRGKVEHLLVCTKANDINTAIAGIAHRLDPGAAIVIAANGMGYMNDIAALLPDNNRYCCLSTDGAYQLAPLHIRHAGHGSNLIGSPAGRAEPEWLDDWKAGFLEAGWSPDITAAQWHKLAINCAINPLTALHRCHNGELASNPALKEEVLLLCDELCAISALAGFEHTAASLHAEVLTVIENTANNRSSMLQDVLAGRETEINYINGHMLRTARQLKMDAPMNQKLVREVTALGQ